MLVRILCVATAVVWFASLAEPGLAEKRGSTYRVLEGRHACLPCGVEPRYIVIDSYERVNNLHAKLQEICGESKSPDKWRQFVIGLDVDFRDEAIIAMYEVIGTGGKASLDFAGPEDGVLRASIKWHTGPPPHVPIATAACLTFAVQKSAIKKVDIMPGGVLSKDRRKLSLIVPEGRPNKTASADAPLH